MDREIIFRGKRLDNNEWVYGGLLQSEFSCSGHSECTIVGSFAFCNDIGRNDVHPLEVGQWTGRRDKGSKRIFEGDVVCVDDSGVGGMPHEMVGGTYKVVWNDIEAMFMLEQMDEMNGIRFDEVCLYTVLGNIHDNPELLGKEAPNV